MGIALVKFTNTSSCNTAIDHIPYFVGDTIMYVIPKYRGLNHRNCTFTHYVLIMMVNYPLEAWLVEKVHESINFRGRFLVWNKDGSNRAHCQNQSTKYAWDPY
jgi:hypothetical protein